jgi:FkbM family methyltransferase
MNPFRLSRLIEVFKGQDPLRRLTSRLLWASRLCLLIKFQVDGIKYQFSPSSMSAEMWVNPQYLRKETELSLRVSNICNQKTFTVVDVGANIGVFSLSIAKFFPDAEIHAIEPHPRVSRYLKKNINLNQSRIYTHTCALGSKTSEVKISNKHADDMNEIILDTSKPGTTISMQTLDSMFEGMDIWILKIDVEGMEKEVLVGATSVLKRTNNIIIEVDEENYARYGTSNKEVLFLLERSGFELIGINETEQGNLSLSYPLKLMGIRGENVLATRITKDEIQNLLISA